MCTKYSYAFAYTNHKIYLKRSSYFPSTSHFRCINNLTRQVLIMEPLLMIWAVFLKSIVSQVDRRNHWWQGFYKLFMLTILLENAALMSWIKCVRYQITDIQNMLCWQIWTDKLMSCQKTTSTFPFLCRFLCLQCERKGDGRRRCDAVDFPLHGPPTYSPQAFTYAFQTHHRYTHNRQ